MTFHDYCERRGYDMDSGGLNFLLHMFPGCMTQAGVHNFWRVWNPMFGYLLFQQYKTLGGIVPRPLALGATFITSGILIHDLPIGLVLGRPIVVNTVAFVIFAVLALPSRGLERRGLWSRRSWLNVPVHAVIVLGAYAVGAYVNSLVFGRFL